jgi:lysozyme family protein
MAKKDKESKKAKKLAKKADKGTKKEKIEHRARQVGCKTTFPIFFIGSTRRAQGAWDCGEYCEAAGALLWHAAAIRRARARRL